jgi:hypothetical protein
LGEVCLYCQGGVAGGTDTSLYSTVSWPSCRRSIVNGGSRSDKMYTRRFVDGVNPPQCASGHVETLSIIHRDELARLGRQVPRQKQSVSHWLDVFPRQGQEEWELEEAKPPPSGK